MMLILSYLMLVELSHYCTFPSPYIIPFHLTVFLSFFRVAAVSRLFFPKFVLKALAGIFSCKKKKKKKKTRQEADISDKLQML